VTNTWAENLNPTFQKQISDSRARMLLSATLAEAVGAEDPEVQKGLEELNEEFLIQILDRRIEVMKLPISFSPAAKLAILALIDRPGSVVVLLIDCLNAYEKLKVTVPLLVELYPEGFYDEPTLERYVEGYMKPRKVKWSDVYLSR
jgi:hypothetical protein